MHGDWIISHLAGRGEREEGLDDRAGGDEGHEAGVDELDLVHLLRDELGEDLVGDGLQRRGEEAPASGETSCFFSSLPASAAHAIASRAATHAAHA